MWSVGRTMWVCSRCKCDTWDDFMMFAFACTLFVFILICNWFLIEILLLTNVWPNKHYGNVWIPSRVYACAPVRVDVLKERRKKSCTKSILRVLLCWWPLLRLISSIVIFWWRRFGIKRRRSQRLAYQFFFLFQTVWICYQLKRKMNVLCVSQRFSLQLFGFFPLRFHFASAFVWFDCDWAFGIAAQNTENRIEFASGGNENALAHKTHSGYVAKEEVFHFVAIPFDSVVFDSNVSDRQSNPVSVLDRRFVCIALKRKKKHLFLLGYGRTDCCRCRTGHHR